MTAAKPTRAEAAQYAASTAYGHALAAWEMAKERLLIAAHYPEEPSYARAALADLIAANETRVAAWDALLAWQTGKAKP